MDRRDFLKSAAVTGAALTVMGGLPGARVFAAESDSAREAPLLVAVTNGEPEALLDAALKELGGLEQFVPPGKTVVIKPNIGWHQPPEMAADTNPELVGALVKRCLNAGAGKVYVFDHTCDKDWRGCYRVSGIEEAVEKAGGEMVCGNDKSDYREVEVPRGKVLKKALMHRLILDADVFINVPVLKNHGGAKLTASMKNLMGIVWDRQEFHQLGVQQAIADWLTVRRPDLNILDAYRAMQTGGPRGNKGSRILPLRSLLASRDMVALDVAGAKMLNIDPAVATHIAAAEALGLGTADLSRVNIKRIRL